jgi:hypothetical protein
MDDSGTTGGEGGLDAVIGRVERLVQEGKEPDVWVIIDTEEEAIGILVDRECLFEEAYPSPDDLEDGVRLIVHQLVSREISFTTAHWPPPEPMTEEEAAAKEAQLIELTQALAAKWNEEDTARAREMVHGRSVVVRPYLYEDSERGVFEVGMAIERDDGEWVTSADFGLINRSLVGAAHVTLEPEESHEDGDD